jgi:antitoxin VapB
MNMKTAKIFQNGNSQAVRLPKEFQFDDKEVEILKRGDEVILRKRKKSLSEAFRLLTEMPGDFFTEPRYDPLPEEREQF